MAKKLFFLFMIFLSFSGIALARPQIPSQYYGVVSENGLPVAGKDVIVKDPEGSIVSQSMMQSDADGVYLTHVLRDDPETATDEGVVDNEMITFFIDNRKITEATVAPAGTSSELPLAIAGNTVSSPRFSATQPVPAKTQSTDMESQQVADRSGPDIQPVVPADDNKPAIITNSIPPAEQETALAAVDSSSETTAAQQGNGPAYMIAITITLAILAIGILLYFIIIKGVLNWKAK